MIPTKLCNRCLILHWADNNGKVCCVYFSCHVEKPHQEHIVPLSKGGACTKSNIIPSYDNRNRKKYTKSLREFYEYSDSFSEESYQKIIRFVQSFKSEVA